MRRLLVRHFLRGRLAVVIGGLDDPHAVSLDQRHKLVELASDPEFSGLGRREEEAVLIHDGEVCASVAPQGDFFVFTEAGCSDEFPIGDGCEARVADLGVFSAFALDGKRRERDGLEVGLQLAEAFLEFARDLLAVFLAPGVVFEVVIEHAVGTIPAEDGGVPLGHVGVSQIAVEVGAEGRVGAAVGVAVTVQDVAVADGDDRFELRGGNRIAHSPYRSGVRNRHKLRREGRRHECDREGEKGQDVFH